ncbi:MAG TPA: EF-hand domain-containing protein [Sphingomicrobium sp.]
MPIAAVIVLLAAAAPEPPITVTGHAWAPFISPMGEPFRARTTADDTFVKWFTQADRDHDGTLTAAEMQADAERFFATLDVNRDGEIDPEELIRYEWEVAPEIQVNMRQMRAPGEPRPKKRRREEAAQGAARYALLNIPEPVAAADADFDRAITLTEFREAAIARFQLLDSARSGRLSLTQLQAMLPVPGAKPRREEKDSRIGNPLPPGE